MNKKFVIYDPPMCCSTGLCGPNPDQKLIDLQNTLEELKKMGVEVERYIITQRPDVFKENGEVIKLIRERQIKALPITTLDGKVVKTGEYPSLEEFKQFINENL